MDVKEDEKGPQGCMWGVERGERGVRGRVCVGMVFAVTPAWVMLRGDNT